MDIILATPVETSALYLNFKLVTFAILGMCNYMLKWYKKSGSLSVVQATEQFIALVSEGLFVNSATDIPHKP